MRLNVEKSGNLRTADEADNNFNNADNKVKDFLKFSFIHTIKKLSVIINVLITLHYEPFKIPEEVLIIEIFRKHEFLKSNRPETGARIFAANE